MRLIAFSLYDSIQSFLILWSAQKREEDSGFDFPKFWNASKNDLLLFVNPKDYKDLKCGLLKNYKQGYRKIDLNGFEISSVYAISSMEPSHATIIWQKSF